MKYLLPVICITTLIAMSYNAHASTKQLKQEVLKLKTTTQKVDKNKTVKMVKQNKCRKAYDPKLKTHYVICKP